MNTWSPVGSVGKVFVQHLLCSPFALVCRISSSIALSGRCRRRAPMGDGRTVSVERQVSIAATSMRLHSLTPCRRSPYIDRSGERRA